MKSMPELRDAGAKRERGAAALVVVMMLFLIMALLAAYANRSLLFEQRIAAGYNKAALAQEMAESGIDWTVAMLNSPAINATCQPQSLAAGGVSFRDRYLKLNSNRLFGSVTWPAGTVTAHAECIRVAGGGLQCRCPDSGPTGTGLSRSVALADVGVPQPSFVVRLNAGTRGGTVQVYSLGCSSSAASGECANWQTTQTNQLGAATMQSMVAFVSSVKSPPSAPLTMNGRLTVTDGNLALHNAEARSGGLLLVTGDGDTGLIDAKQDSLPGTPVSAAKMVDSSLSLASGSTADVLKMFLGMPLSRYKNHPALREVVCGADCGAALQAAYGADRRMVVINGPATIGNQTLGNLTATSATPMMIVVDGNVTLNGPLNLTGMLVVNGNLTTATGGGAALISGAVLVNGNVNTTGALDILYKGTVIDALNNQLGSFVRVPASWADTYGPNTIR